MKHGDCPRVSADILVSLESSHCLSETARGSPAAPGTRRTRFSLSSGDIFLASYLSLYCTDSSRVLVLTKQSQSTFPNLFKNTRFSPPEIDS